MKIRFCENNKGSGKVLKKLKENYPDLNIKRKDCIKNCAPCRKSPFALVQEKIVKAEDGEDLYEKIVALLKND